MTVTTVTIGHATVTKILRNTAYRSIGGQTICDGYHVAIPQAGGIYKAWHATRFSAYRGAAAMTALYARSLATTAANS